MTENQVQEQGATEERPKEFCCGFDIQTKHRHEFVYVLVFERDIVKIGRTGDPNTRVAAHVSNCSLDLVQGYLFSVVNSVKAEASLLDFYENFKLNGAEWFVIPEEDRTELLEAVEAKGKYSINGSAFWSYCAHQPKCTLCDLLAELEG